MEKLENRLLNKAVEAFIMSIEIYNKPTLKYRTEGFAFFICNAWELMLKAKIIRDEGEEKIYFPEGNNRTIPLEKCIRKVFTNENDPLRKNLETIIDLRNTCTHFITPEYEEIYAPLFQSCVFNFTSKVYDFFMIDITENIPEHFIHLAISTNTMKHETLIAKYGDIIANKYNNTKASIEESINKIQSNTYAIAIHHEYYLTKKRSSNSVIFRLMKEGEDSDEPVRILKELKDPNLTHPFTVKKIVESVNRQLGKLGINHVFTKSSFQDFVKYYCLKKDRKYCFINEINSKPTYQYSQAVVDFIVEQYRKDPDAGLKIHSSLKAKNQLTPGAREF